MAGSISATTVGLIAAGVAAAGVGASVVSGVQQNNAQKKSLQAQTVATQKAETSALSTERQNQTATNAANMKTPDIADIMARAAAASKGGAGSTMLTGAGGTDTGTLGKTSLLGT